MKINTYFKQHCAMNIYLNLFNVIHIYSVSGATKCSQKIKLLQRSSHKEEKWFQEDIIWHLFHLHSELFTAMLLLWIQFSFYTSDVLFVLEFPLRGCDHRMASSSSLYIPFLQYSPSPHIPPHSFMSWGGSIYFLVLKNLKEKV